MWDILLTDTEFRTSFIISEQHSFTSLFYVLFLFFSYFYSETSVCLLLFLLLMFRLYTDSDWTQAEPKKSNDFHVRGTHVVFQDQFNRRTDWRGKDWFFFLLTNNKNKTTNNLFVIVLKINPTHRTFRELQQLRLQIIVSYLLSIYSCRTRTRTSSCFILFPIIS